MSAACRTWYSTHFFSPSKPPFPSSAPVHGIFPFLSNRNPFWIPSNQTSRLSFSKTIDLPHFLFRTGAFLCLKFLSKLSAHFCNQHTWASEGACMRVCMHARAAWVYVPWTAPMAKIFHFINTSLFYYQLSYIHTLLIVATGCPKWTILFLLFVPSWVVYILGKPMLQSICLWTAPKSADRLWPVCFWSSQQTDWMQVT